MPVVRYFLFVGGLLLALLFLYDASAPNMPVVSAAAETGVDKSVIRIRSDRKWPERVVFDTRLEPIVPAPAATTVASVEAPPAATDVSAKAQPLQAFAQLKPAEAKKLEPKPQHRQRKIAKVRTAPPMVLVAQQPPRFGFFDSNW